MMNFALLDMKLPLALLVIIVLLIIFAFEIWMLVSAITNNRISGTAKALWIVGMLLIHPIVAIVYYFTDYQKTR